MSAKIDKHREESFAKMFSPVTNLKKNSKLGTYWALNSNLGGGYLWIYESGKNYRVVEHNLYFHEDTIIENAIPNILSVSWYDSIAGEELKPYRHMKNRVIRSFSNDYGNFRAIIHKNIKIKAIGIEYEMAFLDEYVAKYYANESFNPEDAFKCIDEADNFTEMELLLNQIRQYTGTGLSAELFYDGKAMEALSKVFERHKFLNTKSKNQISDADKLALENIDKYIHHHYADDLHIEQLAKIACMSTTKFKTYFKNYFNATVSNYIISVRIEQAEHFLAYTNIPIEQIANAVGYKHSGYFAEIFKKTKGISPLKYRTIAKR